MYEFGSCLKQVSCRERFPPVGPRQGSGDAGVGNPSKANPDAALRRVGGTARPELHRTAVEEGDREACPGVRKGRRGARAAPRGPRLAGLGASEAERATSSVIPSRASPIDLPIRMERLLVVPPPSAAAPGAPSLRTNRIAAAAAAATTAIAARATTGCAGRSLETDLLGDAVGLGASTSYSRQRSEKPFSLKRPRSRKLTPGIVPASCLTGSETRISPPRASPATRDAPFTAAPNGWPPSSITSPTLRPMRRRTASRRPRCGGRQRPESPLHMRPLCAST